MSVSGRSVMNTWKRCPSTSVKVSCAPGVVLRDGRWLGCRRASGQVDQVGDLGDLGAVAFVAAIRGDCGLPALASGQKDRRYGLFWSGRTRSRTHVRRPAGNRRNPWVSAPESARADHLDLARVDQVTAPTLASSRRGPPPCSTGVPGPQYPGERFAVASRNASSGWNPKVCL